MSKLYTKIQNGSTVILPANKIVVRKDGMQTFNPTEEMILADGWEIYVEPEPSLPEIKANKKAEILAYDSSESINTFSIGSDQLWLDKATRTGLMLRFQAEQEEGYENTTLWNSGKSYTLPLATAMVLLKKLELYASNCYDITQWHLSCIDLLETKEEVETYDYRTNYPEPLRFELPE